MQGLRHSKAALANYMRKLRVQRYEHMLSGKGVVQDCLVNFLQQPLPSLTIEAGTQGALLSLLQYASEDGPILSKGLEDFTWVMDFKEPAHSWSILLSNAFNTMMYCQFSAYTFSSFAPASAKFKIS